MSAIGTETTAGQVDTERGEGDRRIYTDPVIFQPRGSEDQLHLPADRVASMRARVEHRLDRSVLLPDHEHAVAAHDRLDEVTPLGDLGFVAQEQPTRPSAGRAARQLKIEGTMRVFALRPPPVCPARLPARGPSGTRAGSSRRVGRRRVGRASEVRAGAAPHGPRPVCAGNAGTRMGVSRREFLKTGGALAATVATHNALGQSALSLAGEWINTLACQGAQVSLLACMPARRPARQ